MVASVGRSIIDGLGNAEAANGLIAGKTQAFLMNIYREIGVDEVTTDRGALNIVTMAPRDATGDARNRTLIIKNKLVSLRGRMSICDETGKAAYEARGELSVLRPPTWTIANDSEDFAFIRRKNFALSPTWIITGSTGSFVIKRKLFSWSREHHVVGGDFDGAVLMGNLLDLKFEILHHGKTLARANGRILSMRDEHEIEVLTENEPFVVVCMVVLQMARSAESEERRESDDL